MKRFEKVAKPPEAATVVVPVSVPLEGFEPMDIVTLFPVKLVAVSPNASRATTVTAGMTTPATAVLGWTLKASDFAGPAMMSKGVDSSLASDGPAEVVTRV